MFVKLCGLRTIEDARSAIDADASALGFILAESKRQVTPDFVASVRQEIINPPTIVGVTVDLGPASIISIFEEAHLDMVQLSGNEPIAVLDHIDMPMIKAIRLPHGMQRDQAIAEVDAWFSHANAPEIVMIEAGAGGSGEVGDWRLMHEIAVRYPVVLAGGLNPDNVADAIRAVRPIGVDVSSGTETNGSKDPEKLSSFVKNAKRAFDLL